MIALDTNLLVRTVVNDDPVQTAMVLDLIGSNTVFLPRTVLLETEWVLRSRYQQTRPVIEQLLRRLLDAEDVLVEGAWQVSLALDWYQLGADFADALHLATCGSATMHTFDRGFCKQARATGAAPPITVLETKG